MTPADLRSDLYINKNHGEVSGGKSPGRIWHQLIGDSLGVLSSLAINDNGLKWQALDDKNPKGVEPQKSNDIDLKRSIDHNELCCGRSRTIVRPINHDIIWCIHLRGLKKLAFVLTKAMGLSSVGGNPRKKLAFVLTKAMGLSSVGGNPKNNEEIPLLPLERFRGGKTRSHFWSWCFRAKDRILRILFVWGNVWLTRIRISGCFYCQIDQLL